MFIVGFMLLSFFPVDVSYKVIDGVPVIHIYGRAADGSQVCVIDDSFEPYFWVLNSTKEAVEAISVIRGNSETRVKRVEAHEKQFLGKPVSALKVFAYFPGDVPALREAASSIGKVLEADILFPRRYLIDRGIIPLSLCEAEGVFVQGLKSRVPVFRAERIVQSGEEISGIKVLSVDIETHSPFGSAIVPDEQPIIMLALAGENLKKVVTWKRFKTDLDYVEFVESELELIERFKQIVAENMPDVISGYFSDGFDLPYLNTRAGKYKIPLDIGLDYSPVKISGRQVTSAEIAGIVHLDIFNFVKKIFGRSMETVSYDLNSVASEVLSEGKDIVDLSGLYSAWSNNDGLESFCKYNLQDAVLTYKLSLKLLPNLVELVRVVGLSLYDISRMSFSQLVEWYLIREARMFNELVPNRPEYVESRQRIESTYEGAYVFEPVPGLYKDISIFDFRSLYPTIISAHNISPDTMNCVCCASEENVPGFAGIWFCRKRKGFIPTVIESVIKRRMRIKEIMKSAEDKRLLEARQEALKTIANSMYGYLGFFGARWYSIECARSITAYGRNYITEVIRKADDAGFKVLYSDTDSIFLSLQGKQKADAVNFVDEINKSLPGLMELDFQGFYLSGLFVGTKDNKGYGAKKRYALVSSDGSIKIRGFEMVRRNLSMISKEVQEKVLELILKGNDVEGALHYVKETIAKIRLAEIPLEKMIINTQLQKEVGSYDSISPHVAVAQRMKRLGLGVGIGTVISYVVVAGRDRIRDRAKLPSEVKNNEYDPEYYIYNQVIPSVEKIFDVFGIDILGEIEPKTQSKLDKFF